MCYLGARSHGALDNRGELAVSEVEESGKGTQDDGLGVEEDVLLGDTHDGES